MTSNDPSKAFIKQPFQAYADVAQEVLFTLDSNFKLTSINRFAEQHLAMQNNAFIGQPLYLLSDNTEEQSFIQQRLEKFARTQDQHLRFTMHWKVHPDSYFEMSIQLSKLQDQYVGSAKDLSDTLATLQELYESKTNFETLIEKSLTGILITDLKGIVLFANQAASDLMNWPKSDLIGFAFGYIQSNMGDEKFEIDLLRPGMPPGRAEVSSMQTIWREQPANLVIIHDITSLYEAKKRIEEMAYFDELTQLPNRIYFMSVLHKTIERYERHGNGFALFYMDLNDFKTINENYGHSSGDKLLNQVSQRFKNIFRDEDVVARIGGDEFTAIVEQVIEPAALKAICLKILNAFKHKLNIDDHPLYIQPSIGISLYPQNATDPDMLLSQADLAMYHAKAHPSEPYMFYDSSMSAQNSHSTLRHLHIYEALKRDEFVLYYQPQQDLNSGKIVGVEALIRWNHPQDGLIAPDLFIPILEQTGLIVEVGYWVLDQAIALLEYWQRIEQTLRKISINVSPIQLYSAGFIDKVIHKIEQSKIDPQYIAIEITESVFISNKTNTRQMILQLQAKGIEVHMDDFGSGYSSFNELKSLPFDVIKIDREFIQHIDTDNRDIILVEAMIHAFHGLGKKVIAEGIETLAHKTILKSLKCDIIQGYLLSKPIPAEQLTPCIEHCEAQDSF